MRDLSPEFAVDTMPWLLSLTADMHDWPPWTAAQFLADRPRKWDLSFMHEHGVAILSEPEPGRVHVHLLAVHPDHRGSGAGSEIMAEIKRRAAGKKLTLKVPRDGVKARAFYEQHGFALAGADTARWLEMVCTTHK